MFCSYSSWGRAQKKDIIGIEIFKVDGEVCVYKKGMF
nr:MAG TPA: Insect kinin peptide [Caudoviricetes sp.]